MHVCACLQGHGPGDTADQAAPRGVLRCCKPQAADHRNERNDGWLGGHVQVARRGGWQRMGQAQACAVGCGRGVHMAWLGQHMRAAPCTWAQHSHMCAHGRHRCEGRRVERCVDGADVGGERRLPGPCRTKVMLFLGWMPWYRQSRQPRARSSSSNSCMKVGMLCCQ